MSAIQAISAARATVMANNSMLNMINASSARMGLISSMGGSLYCGQPYSLDALCAMDTQYELDMITNSLQYKMAKAMAESMRKLQKEEAKKFSIFA